MLATNLHNRRFSRQRGSAAVEFSLLAIVFFLFVFGMCELSRAMYLVNTLQEVTRRAAVIAATSAFDEDEIKKIQRQSLFQDQDGNLLLGAPITPDHIRIEYLSMSHDSTTGGLGMSAVLTKPSSAAENRLTCLADPYAAKCIRFVRVQVCDPDVTSTCSRVQYKMLFPLVDLSALKLPSSTTILPVQSVGYTLGSTP
jgi:hypothetical protein